MALRARIALVAAFGLALGLGCGFDAQGKNQPPAPGLGAQQTSGPAGKPDDPADDSGDESAGISGGGSSSGSNPTAGSGPSSASDTADTADTSASTTGFPGDPSGGTDSGGSSGGSNMDPAPTEAFVSNVDIQSCGDAVGCWSGQTPGGPFLVVECYDNPVPLPYEVRSVHVNVWWRASQFDDLQVQVLDRNVDGTPGAAIWSGWMSNQPTVGVNDIVFSGGNPEPNTQDFCVGFYVPDGGWDGGIDFATAGGAGQTSWYGNCGASSWTEMGTWGQWCVGAAVDALAIP